MALDPKYITAPSLQQYFVDKDSGEPLAGGKVYFYSDTNREQPKNIYELQGNQANYTYKALPNPIILSGVGTIQNNNKQDVIPYYFPFEENNPNARELYYIEVTNSLGVPQFTRQAWPNPDTFESGEDVSNAFNYIPNGQLLAHTSLQDDALGAGENIIAQGGISIVLPDPAVPAPSTNTLEFEVISGSVGAPSSPRYLAKLTSINPNPAEDIKAIRIKWRNVNKFSTEEDPPFTFGFWASANVEIPFELNIFKFFGTNGDKPDLETVAVSTIDPFPNFYSFSFSFGENVGNEIDEINNDDFIAIEINLSRNIAFELQFTDLVLIIGETTLTTFPIQTNADMLSRGVAGWMPTPRENGYDLYLPLVLTREGMTFDDSDIGKIRADVGDIPLPGDPTATSNELPCDGATYIAADSSFLGIPYARLRDKLIEKSPVADYPLFGTGTQFASALPVGTDRILLMVNNFGAGIQAAADFNTGFAISPAVLYAGASVGSASINYLSAYLLSVGNQLIARATNFNVPANPLADGTPATGFTFDATLNEDDELYSSQNRYAFSVATVSGAALANAGNPARNYLFSNAATSYYMWYVVSNETDPAVGGRTSIQININADYTSDDVALVTSGALNAYQMSNIDINGVPTSSQYFTFQTNPGAIRSFYVWYRFSLSDTDPNATGTGIPVDLLVTDGIAEVRAKTIAAINRTEFAVPDLRGMFLRGADTAGDWDLDNATRFGFGQAIGGANYGTYEYQQLLLHNHASTNSISYRFAQGTTNPGPRRWSSLSLWPENVEPSNGVSGDSQTTITITIADTGGTETRPVNAYVNWVMKY